MKLTDLLLELYESTVDMDPSVGNDNRFNQDVSNTQSMTSPGMRLMLTPGAPFGGNIAGISNVVLSNEARVALRDWVSLAKQAWQRYGNPNEFPPELVQRLEDLGGAFERTTGPREPGTGYRP